MEAKMSENLAEKCKWLLEENGVTGISSVSTPTANENGSSLASLTQTVTVHFQKEASKPPLHLFVKTLSSNPSHLEMINDMKAFETEARFFMEYLPEARELCKRFRAENLMDIYPTCYYGDESIIILENLVMEKGYSVRSDEERHDLETARLALESLATHHAISYVVIKSYPNREAFFERFPNLDYDPWLGYFLTNMMENLFENTLEACIDIVESSGNFDQDVIQKLQSFQGKSIKMSADAIKSVRSTEPLVLIHADYKNNNMMFRKDLNHTGKLEHVAIDFQSVCCNTPALDIVFYLFTTVDPNLRRTQLANLLNIYRHTFNHVTEKLGQPAALSFEELQSGYKQRALFGFWRAIPLAGPGMAVVSMSDDIDVTQMDMSNFGKFFQQSLLKWIELHPEKKAEVAEEIVHIMNECNELFENCKEITVYL